MTRGTTVCAVTCVAYLKRNLFTRNDKSKTCDLFCCCAWIFILEECVVDKTVLFQVFQEFQVIWLHLITGKHWLIFKLVFFYEPSEHHTASDLNRLMKRVLWLHRGWARIGPCVCHLPGIDGCCPPTPVHHTGFHQLQKWIQNGSRKWCLCKCHCHHSISITMAPLVVIEQHRKEVSQRWHECDLPSTRCIIIFKVSRRPNNYS